MADESAVPVPPVVLDQVESIQSLDTARMALRWSLERINTLQREREALKLEVDVPKAHEALAQWQASFLESSLLQLTSLAGVDQEALYVRVSKHRSEYEALRHAIETDVSERARLLLVELTKAEDRFKLLERFVAGRLSAAQAKTDSDEAGTELSRMLGPKRAPLRVGTPNPAPARRKDQSEVSFWQERAEIAEAAVARAKAVWGQVGSLRDRAERSEAKARDAAERCAALELRLKDGTANLAEARLSASDAAEHVRRLEEARMRLAVVDRDLDRARTALAAAEEKGRIASERCAALERELKSVPPAFATPPPPAEAPETARRLADAQARLATVERELERARAASSGAAASPPRESPVEAELRSRLAEVERELEQARAASATALSSGLDTAVNADPQLQSLGARLNVLARQLRSMALEDQGGGE